LMAFNTFELLKLLLKKLLLPFLTPQFSPL
jgi:hypothetical protein